jgi:hypothetical protein
MTYHQNCANCGREFTSTRNNVTCCSVRCRVALHRGSRPAPERISVTAVTDIVPADLRHFAQSEGITVEEAWMYARQFIREQHDELERMRGASVTDPDAERMGEDEFDQQRAEIDATYADGRIVKLEEHIAGLERLLADREAAMKELELFKREHFAGLKHLLADKEAAVKELEWFKGSPASGPDSPTFVSTLKALYDAAHVDTTMPAGETKKCEAATKALLVALQSFGRLPPIPFRPWE